MRIRNRAGAVGLIASLALAIGAQASSAAIEPPVRPFQARYVASLTPTPSNSPLRLSGTGAASWLGPSSISGRLVIMSGGPCQPFRGSALLASTPSPASHAPIPKVRIYLTGVLCTPLEGAAFSISGSYRTRPSPVAWMGGNGSFRGVADGPAGTTTLVVYFKGTI